MVTASDGGQAAELEQLAHELADRLAGDVELARTRDEHVRVTARAVEARRLSDALREAFRTSAGVEG